MRHNECRLVATFWMLGFAALAFGCSGDALVPQSSGDAGATPVQGTGARSSGAATAGEAALGGGGTTTVIDPSAAAAAPAGGSGSAASAGSGSDSDGTAAAGNETSTGGVGTSDGAPGLGGGTNDGTGAGGNTGDGARGGDTGDGARGGSTGDGVRGGDTGDGAKGGGTGDGCIPVCFPSVLDNVNVIVLNDATADGADVEGRMYVAHDANFPSYAIGTRMTPDAGRADLIVGNDLYFGGGAVPNGKVSYAGVLERGDASTLGGYHNESLIDFAAVEQEMTADSERLAALTPNGTVSTGLEVFFTGTDPTLNVFEVQASDLATMTSMTISAPASSTVVVNIRGDTVGLHDFGFHLVGVAREHVVYNLPEATSLAMSGVGI
ncbi:MAG TPA: choice-of-anchor A family protein, partial [Polyangiaceae bacterium]|nr:choice-of-anchor A family protein [Polyangiaceae bacterium]